MRRTTFFCLLATLSLGCDDIRQTADAATTVRIGADQLSSVAIERTVSLPVDSLPICLNVMLTLPPDNTTVRLIKNDSGCALSVDQPDVVLLDQQEIQNARQRTKGFDIDAVRRGSFSLEQVELWTDQGAPLDLARYVDAVSVQLDNQALLDRIAPPMLNGSDGQPLTKPIPATLLDKLKSAVKSNQEAKAEVTLTLILHGETLSDLPAGLKLRVVLQPELEVNVVDAAF